MSFKVDIRKQITIKRFHQVMTPGVFINKLVEVIIISGIYENIPPNISQRLLI